jgi:hypothetical protein
MVGARVAASGIVVLGSQHYNNKAQNLCNTGKFISTENCRAHLDTIKGSERADH